MRSGWHRRIMELMQFSNLWLATSPFLSRIRRGRGGAVAGTLGLAMFAASASAGPADTSLESTAQSASKTFLEQKQRGTADAKGDIASGKLIELWFGPPPSEELTRRIRALASFGITVRFAGEMYNDTAYLAAYNATMDAAIESRLGADIWKRVDLAVARSGEPTKAQQRPR
jgi:hypothetical protein